MLKCLMLNLEDRRNPSVARAFGARAGFTKQAGMSLRDLEGLDRWR